MYRKETAIGRGPVQPEPRVRESYREEVLQLKPEPVETETRYGTFQAIDYNDMLLTELHDRLCRLRNVLDPILEICPERAPEDNPKRNDNSVLNSRLNTQAIILENYNNLVEDLIGKVRL